MGPKRKALSQPAGSVQSRNGRNRNTLTQPSVEESFRRVAQITNEELNELANDCVRYMIYKAGHQLPFRKNDLQKHLKGAVGKNFDIVLEKASNILEKVYGFKVILCDGGSKFHILSNNLPYITEDQDVEQTTEIPNDRNKILLLLVLTHIFMSKTAVTQGSLYSFLKNFHIDPERKHEVFKDVKDYINVTLVKQHYLCTVKDGISQEVSYQWGERAEKEISKMQILQLVCKVFKSPNPKAWVTQYKEADEQPVENNRNENLANGEEMDVE